MVIRKNQFAIKKKNSSLKLDFNKFAPQKI